MVGRVSLRVLAQVLVFAGPAPRRGTAPPSVRGRRSSPRSTSRRSRCSRCRRAAPPSRCGAGTGHPLACGDLRQPFIRVAVIVHQHLGDALQFGILELRQRVARRRRLPCAHSRWPACTNAMSSMRLADRAAAASCRRVDARPRGSAGIVDRHQRHQRGAAGRPVLDGQRCGRGRRVLRAVAAPGRWLRGSLPAGAGAVTAMPGRRAGDRDMRFMGRSLDSRISHDRPSGGSS